MSKPSLDTLLKQARQGYEHEVANADTTNLQRNILASLANESPAITQGTAHANEPSPAQPWLWSWITAALHSPWRLSTAALLPLVIGFSLGSVDTLQSLEQLGEGYDTAESLLIAEPNWNALVEDTHE